MTDEDDGGTKMSPQEQAKFAEDFTACLMRRDTLEAVLDSVADGIFTVDDQMRITTFNLAAALITGFSKEEAFGISCLEVFRQILFGQECLVCRALEKRDYVRDVEREITRKDGSRRLVLVTTTPLLDPAGERTGVVVVFRDIQEIRDLREQLRGRHQFHQLIGKNHRMQEIYRLIEQVADSTASVLIEGESGTGKELVAHAIHYRSPRANGPFVTVNCSSLVETLLESELFGHVKGAFTGATYNKVGRFELADSGTILLDEIGDVSPMIQLKLLRILQEKAFERVGESKPRKVDVRVIAATNKDLWKLVQEGRFRDDLYYRLKVVAIHLPSLRERRDDIPLLIQHFVEKLNREMGKKILGGTKEAIASLMAYPWPGNVRELENAIEHAFVLCKGRWFTLEDLPAEIRKSGVSAETSVPGAPDGQEAERLRILEALEAAGGRPSEAARRLGISRTTLWRKLKKYHMRPLRTPKEQT
jgi:PAS domain S-box-containing protein